MGRYQPTIDDLIEQERAANAARQERRAGAWGVPESAIEEFLALEDALGDKQARSVLELVLAIFDARQEAK